MDWTDVAEDKDKWRALVSAGRKFLFHKMRAIS